MFFSIILKASVYVCMSHLHSAERHNDIHFWMDKDKSSTKQHQSPAPPAADGKAPCRSTITFPRKRSLMFFPKRHQQRSGYKQLWNSRNMWRAQKCMHYLESEYATFHRSKTIPHSYFLPVGGQCLYSRCVCQEEHFCTCSSSSC